jgi:hypothetical protein
MPATVGSILEQVQKANPNTLPDMLRRMRLDRLMQPISVTCTITSAASIDITTLRTVASGAGAVPSANSPVLALNELLPPVRYVRSLRVVTGTATGFRNVADPGGTPSTTLATLSEDGKTITFEAVITVFQLTYYGGPDVGTTPQSSALTPSP